MAYASVTDVENRMSRPMTASEQTLCSTLLDDASILIDSYHNNASEYAKKVVCCRIVLRVLGSGDDAPIGASQSTMSALGYSQTWTLPSGSSTGEIYLSKGDKRLLGVGNLIGSHSPIEEV